MRHPNITKALAVLRAPSKRPGFRTARQWQQLRNAFDRWPRLAVLRSGRTTWASCLRCRRPGPRSVMRSFCTDCAVGRHPLMLWGAELERQHAWLVPGVKLWNEADERDWFKYPTEPVRGGALVWVP